MRHVARTVVAIRFALSTRQELLLECLALRHQLGVLARSNRRFRPSDHLLWLILRRLWPPRRDALVPSSQPRSTVGIARAASPAIGARLTSCEMLVHGSNRDRALAHRFGHAFDGAVAHVTHREHAGHAGFEGQGWSVGRARIGWQVAPREHEAMIVATDRRAEPVRARFSSDHHEQGGSRDGFMSALNILELERGEAPRSVTFDDTTS